MKAFGKGKIERWFKTVRAQLLTRLSAEDTASLTALNRRLAAWIEGEYHHTPHRGLAGLTPLEQWAQSAEGVRFPEPTLDLDDLFLFEAKRKVQKDRTVSLNGVVYEVDAALVGETVLLRFDPAARLKHLLELRAIGLVTGEAGSGKTTVCRKVAAALHPGLYRVFYVPLSTGNVMDMYKSIGWELGLPIERNRAAAFRAIRGEISRLSLEARQRPVLIVDEAHHLRNDVLEDLRLLTNYQMDSENRLCLLLVGLTELRRRLAMAVHESLAQRIVVRYHLAGLTREELPEYLVHRLRLAGCELPLFEPPAVEALFQATQGMPRKVNRLAHYALTSAAIGQARTVTAEQVQTAREEVAP